MVESHPPPFGYRWRNNGLMVTNIVLHETTCYLTLTNVRPIGTNMVFTYTVVVTNAAFPSGVVSSNALLTVLQDSDSDGLPDDWETAHNLNTTNAVDAASDTDQDGFSNSQEYLAGTDPNNSEDFLRIDTVHWNAGFSLQFSAVSNKTYTVQSCPAPGGRSWTRMIDVPAFATNRTVIVSVPATPAPDQSF